MNGGPGVGGVSGNNAARKGLTELAAGFGLVQDMLVDQPFSERGRMGRLLSAFAANPGLIGIGLDENTAAFIDSDGILEVLGSEKVTIMDGRDTVSDYQERELGEILTITKSSLHVLGAGRKFDLTARQLVVSPEGAFA